MKEYRFIDADFYRILLKSETPPVTLLEGYDPQTARVPQTNELSLQSKVQLSIAKNIVSTAPLNVNDCCNYLLRLLWMRQNWLLPKKSMERHVYRDKNNDLVESWRTKNEYVDIDSTEITPLLCEALLFFCDINIASNYPKQVIDLIIERKYILCDVKIWPFSGVKEFYSLTQSGMRVAERSEPRLKQLVAFSAGLTTPDDSVSADLPTIYTVATDKENRQAHPLEVVEPTGVYVQNDDGKVIENAVYCGTLQANFAMSGKGLTEQERNRLLHKALGIGAAEIVDRNGTSKTDRKSEVERVKKQLQRSH